jgi:hypothetical protein
VSFVGETDTNVVFLNWGNTEGIVSVSVNNSCGTEYDSIYIKTVSQTPYPDPAVNHQIPGTINAVNYDSGGEGFSYHDNEAENQGPGPRQDEGVDTENNDGSGNIGWIKVGEWVEYSVDVESSELYDLELRIASLNGGGQMEIHFNDEDRTGTISIPSTGSWSSFTSIYVDDIQLYDTDNLMRLQFNVGDFNISRLIFSKISTSISDISSNSSNIIIYPIPANEILHVANQKESHNYTIINLLGVVIQTGVIVPGSTINIQTLQKGNYYITIYNQTENFNFTFIKL